MKLSLREYRDKVEGCWLGKNIGGTLGAPLETRRGVFSLDFYSQPLSGEPLPNDDLDLQLVWLNAVERYGRTVDAGILGEYWLSFIGADWAEYSIGMSNMRNGLPPPFSGHVRNSNRASCGAFIRAEIWACLAPGHPEIAVRYAYQDAIVDHSGEGVFGEVFCAAVQSAAFTESDKFKLIDIGLSYIPSDCAVAGAVKLVLESKRNKIAWSEVRKRLLQTYPSTFGMLTGYEDREPEKDVPFGQIGFDAPVNVALAMLGWVYGEDDFGKSLCTAVNCGEDADCTGGTLGSILGIIGGAKGIPEKWAKPVGRGIKTVALKLGNIGWAIPKNIDELTERVIRQTPMFLGSKLCDILAEGGYAIEANSGEALFNRPVRRNAFYSEDVMELIRQQPFKLDYQFPFCRAIVDYGEEPFVGEGRAKKFKFRFISDCASGQWLEVKWHLPEGWSVSPGRETRIALEHFASAPGVAEAEYTVTPAGLDRARYDLVAEISSVGRHSKGLIPVVLIAGT